MPRTQSSIFPLGEMFATALVVVALIGLVLWILQGMPL